MLKITGNVSTSNSYANNLNLSKANPSSKLRNIEPFHNSKILSAVRSQCGDSGVYFIELENHLEKIIVIKFSEDIPSEIFINKFLSYNGFTVPSMRLANDNEVKKIIDDEVLKKCIDVSNSEIPTVEFDIVTLDRCEETDSNLADPDESNSKKFKPSCAIIDNSELSDRKRINLNEFESFLVMQKIAGCDLRLHNNIETPSNDVSTNETFVSLLESLGKLLVLDVLAANYDRFDFSSQPILFIDNVDKIGVENLSSLYGNLGNFMTLRNIMRPDEVKLAIIDSNVYLPNSQILYRTKLIEFFNFLQNDDLEWKHDYLSRILLLDEFKGLIPSNLIKWWQSKEALDIAYQSILATLEEIQSGKTEHNLELSYEASEKSLQESPLGNLEVFTKLQNQREFILKNIQTLKENYK